MSKKRTCTLGFILFYLYLQYNTININRICMLYTCVRCTHILHCDVTRDMERKNTPSSFWCFIEAHSPHLARYFTSIVYDLPPHLCATCHLPLAHSIRRQSNRKQENKNQSQPRWRRCALRCLQIPNHPHFTFNLPLITWCTLSRCMDCVRRTQTGCISSR